MANYIKCLLVFSMVSLVLSASLPEDPIEISMNNFSITANENKGLKSTEINLEQLQKNHPKLVFLGKYNNKNFYLERTRATQVDARKNRCPALGMTLARLESQDEVNFIGSVITAADNNLWTDGRNIKNPSGYVWDDSHSIPQNIEIYYTSGVYVGWLFYNNAGNFQFRIAYADEEFYYLCYL